MCLFRTAIQVILSQSSKFNDLGHNTTRMAVLSTNESSNSSLYEREFSLSLWLNNNFSLRLWAKHVLRLQTIGDNRRKNISKEVLIPFDSLLTQTKLREIAIKTNFSLAVISFHIIYGHKRCQKSDGKDGNGLTGGSPPALLYGHCVIDNALAIQHHHQLWHFHLYTFWSLS